VSRSTRRARDIGLVNHVVPYGELDAKVDWLLARVIDKSPVGIRRGKYTLSAMGGMSFEQRMAFTESQVALCANTEDAQEGVASFNERRPPVWPNR